MPPILTTLLFMTGIGAVAAAVLIVAARFFTVPVDPRIEEVLAALPGANCGACGYSGCAAAATAVTEGKSGPNVCVIGSSELSSAIAAIMKVQVTSAGKSKIAFLCCSRNKAEAGINFISNSPQDCRAAITLYGGGKQCSGGCIGLGTCETICPVGAIIMENGLPKINAARCTSCGMCVKICPKKIIALVEDAPEAIIKKKCAEFCVQTEVMFEVNQSACIKCGICYKNCPVEAIVWEKATSACINKNQCIHCYTCLRLCPAKVIS